MSKVWIRGAGLEPYTEWPYWRFKTTFGHFGGPAPPYAVRDVIHTSHYPRQRSSHNPSQIANSGLDLNLASYAPPSSHPSHSTTPQQAQLLITLDDRFVPVIKRLPLDDRFVPVIKRLPLNDRFVPVIKRPPLDDRFG
ncbi:hypothetical protein PCANC_07192 [Puccinia coronata f. sp. avenae]|uniref:Uncharacterized protein n=1 Tax=Puccinia coronata f. sp. avenae TaxID=200324 RepID=A0A2N5RZ07_9BASI|nr:hypothetical protein PCANC_27323 [Puccinia coronata f. sp. avenae]PLW53514.1 hypothetical protein PCANC_07192 [Puccinia coronata f. sp. avenae]